MRHLYYKQKQKDLVLDWDNAGQENLINSDAKMTVVPAFTSNNNGYNRVLFLKIEGVVEEALFTMYKTEEDPEGFTGYIFIRKINRKFVCSLKIEKGMIVAIMRKKQLTTKSSKEDTCDCDCDDEIHDWGAGCDEEVVITATHRKNLNVRFIFPRVMDVREHSAPDEGGSSYNYGGGGGSPSDSAVSPLPKVDEVKKEPCNEWKEMVKETDKRQRARNAIKCLLGMKAYPYIQFDANGKLNVGKLEEAKGIIHTSDVNQTNQDLYDALLFMAKDASIVITNLKGKVNVIVNGVNQEVTLEKIESLYNRYKDPEDRIKLLGYSVMKNKEVYYTEERINYKGLPEVHQVTVSGSRVNKLHKQAIILGHELLGHMYMFLKGKHYKHPLGSGNMSKEEREFENYIKDIERQIRHNTREIKRAMKILPDCM